MASRLTCALIERLLRSNELFVEIAYRVVLGRPPDPEALVNCRRTLGGGRARIQLLDDFFRSEEFQQSVAQSRANSELREYDVRGLKLALFDVAGYPTRDIVIQELVADVYGLEAIPIADGDHVVDVGANLGAVAIYVAKRHPGAIVHAFEPVPQTFDFLQRNIEANRCANIRAHRRAVTADGRTLKLAAVPEFLAGASAHYDPLRVSGPRHVQYSVESITLDAFFAETGITRCKLLKVDCEGSEYEILLGAKCLAAVDHLSAEFHTNARLRAAGYTPAGLLEHCRRFIPADRVQARVVEMAE